METIDPQKFLLKITSILDELKINYFITGGFAVSVWGRPRATFDIDVVLIILKSDLNLLIAALRKLSKAGYVDEDTARYALKNNGEFNFVDPETGLKVDFWVAGHDERTVSQFKRKIIKKINGQKICFVSPEDLVLNKLIWFHETQSTRHLEDAQSVIKISKLNKKLLKEWAVKLGVSDELNKLLKQ